MTRVDDRLFTFRTSNITRRMSASSLAIRTAMSQSVSPCRTVARTNWSTLPASTPRSGTEYASATMTRTTLTKTRPILDLPCARRERDTVLIAWLDEGRQDCSRIHLTAPTNTCSLHTIYERMFGCRDAQAPTRTIVCFSRICRAIMLPSNPAGGAPHEW